jgi:hypothetical protein
LVKKNDSGEIFAMKSMIKHAMVKKNQVRRHPAPSHRVRQLPPVPFTHAHIAITCRCRLGTCARRETSWRSPTTRGS